MKKWFGPKGWPLTLCEMDFRVGGRFRFAMTGPDGKQNTPFGGEYREIVPNRKIVYDNAFELPGAEPMIVTVPFDEKGGKTTLTIHTLFASVAMRDAHVGGGYEQGFGSAPRPARGRRRRYAAQGAAPLRKLILSELVTLTASWKRPAASPVIRTAGGCSTSWARSRFRSKLGEVLEAESLLIGRVTYELFAEAWPKRSGQFADKMPAMPKHVVSTTLQDPERTQFIGDQAATDQRE